MPSKIHKAHIKIIILPIKVLQASLKSMVFRREEAKLASRWRSFQNGGAVTEKVLSPTRQGSGIKRVTVSTDNTGIALGSEGRKT